MVVACVIPHAGEQLTEDGICTTLRQRLASFKVPRAVLFFTEEEFPVTGSEKVKASDLRELASKRLERVKVVV
jgi:acyl-CoA synthetase (AMP-forming)/AMP-acid ligase II